MIVCSTICTFDCFAKKQYIAGLIHQSENDNVNETHN